MTMYGEDGERTISGADGYGPVILRRTDDPPHSVILTACKLPGSVDREWTVLTPPRARELTAALADMTGGGVMDEDAARDAAALVEAWAGQIMGLGELTDLPPLGELAPEAREVLEAGIESCHAILSHGDAQAIAMALAGLTAATLADSVRVTGIPLDRALAAIRDGLLGLVQAAGGEEPPH